MCKKKVDQKCRDPGSNRGPLDLQSNALPTELSRPHDSPVAVFKNHYRGAELAKWIVKVRGPTEIWTRIAGFRVQSANHYTTGPCWYRDFVFTTLFIVWQSTCTSFFLTVGTWDKMFHWTICYVYIWEKKVGSSGIWTRDLSHPKRESYP